jgi:hypothetical protein
VQVFVTKEFARFPRKERIDDRRLCEAIGRACRGKIDADLGGSVIKQRVARASQGRSSGYRTIIAFRSAGRSVFMYGFAKNRKANLTKEELAVYRRLAKVFLDAADSQITDLMDDGELSEIPCDVEEPTQISQ